MYISQANHRRITAIVNFLGNNDLTIADYLENVLNGHFQNYRDEINRMFDAIPKVEL